LTSTLFVATKYEADAKLRILPTRGLMMRTTNAVHVEAPNRLRSSELYSRGLSVFPAGITRSTIERDPDPIYVSGGHGAYVVDVDGNRFLDLNNNFTTLLHGHAFEPIVEAVAEMVRSGTCFSNPTRHEIALAELLVSRIPAIEHVRFVNTGTEAVMFAIKAARAYTGRSAIARFEGAYHGAYDLAEARPGRDPSRPDASVDDIELLQFNDADGLEASLTQNANRLAAVLIDPMPSRAGLITPKPEFLGRLMEVARRHGILIIADEVLNLRQGYAGASARYGLEPDLLTAGKIIGGGFPIGAIGGRAEVMSVFGDGPGGGLVAQGGTFSANPVSMRAGFIAMDAATPECLHGLEAKGDKLRSELTSIATAFGAPFSVTGAASLFRIHARRQTPTTYIETVPNLVEKERLQALTRFFRAEGILLPFGAAACLSTAMNDQDLAHVATTFEAFLAQHNFQSEETEQ
jgi:glutamate-1-semialdehyde 2,1-aminomutase